MSESVRVFQQFQQGNGSVKVNENLQGLRGMSRRYGDNGKESPANTINQYAIVFNSVTG